MSRTIRRRLDRLGAPSPANDTVRAWLRAAPDDVIEPLARIASDRTAGWDAAAWHRHLDRLEAYVAAHPLPEGTPMIPIAKIVPSEIARARAART